MKKSKVCCPLKEEEKQNWSKPVLEPLQKGLIAGNTMQWKCEPATFRRSRSARGAQRRMKEEESAVLFLLKENRKSSKKRFLPACVKVLPAVAPQDWTMTDCMSWGKTAVLWSARKNKVPEVLKGGKPSVYKLKVGHPYITCAWRKQGGVSAVNCRVYNEYIWQFRSELTAGASPTAGMQFWRKEQSGAFNEGESQNEN